MADPKRKPDALEDLLEHYEEVDEDSRLRSGWGRLEFVRTQELVLRHLKPAPAVVLDVGGGSGIYACWLASLGYEVHLIDSVPKHIDQALSRSKQQQKPVASMRVGDARRLDEVSLSADAVLLLGPLYHLTEHADRLKSLREAFRVLRPGGVVLAAAISHFASLFAALTEGFFDKPEFAPILQRDLEEGQHRNTTGNPAYFTTAFFHRPSELQAEVMKAGFRLQEIVAIEGPGWVARDGDQLWNDPAQRARLLECVRKVEQEPAVLGASAHIMAIGKK